MEENNTEHGSPIFGAIIIVLILVVAAIWMFLDSTQRNDNIDTGVVSEDIESQTTN